MSRVDKETSARRDSTIHATAGCDAAGVTRPKTSWRKACPAPAKAERTKPRSPRACAGIRLQRKWSDLACGFQLILVRGWAKRTTGPRGARRKKSKRLYGRKVQ